MTLFFDVDGVFADFDTVADGYLGMDGREYEDLHGSEEFWARLSEIEDFFFSLPLMPDAMVLFEATRHLDPIFLTGAPSQHGELAHLQKIRWGKKHFPDSMLITCRSSQKWRLCKPGDVIVDDWPKHRKKWEAQGGIWVEHVSAEDSVRQLRELGIIN